jgi:thioredoxin 1
MPVTPVTESTFATDVIAASQDRPVLVDFWAPWCGPCKLVAPILDQVNDDPTNRVRIVKVNADEEAALVEQFNVSSIPTMVLIHRGSVVKRIVGARNKPALLLELDGFVN